MTTDIEHPETRFPFCHPEARFPFCPPEARKRRGTPRLTARGDMKGGSGRHKRARGDKKVALG